MFNPVSYTHLDVYKRQHVTLGGRSLKVDGIAVTAAVPAYPYTVDDMNLDLGNGAWNQATGLVWATEATARSFVTPSAPLNYCLLYTSRCV